MRREPWDWPQEPRRGRRRRPEPVLEGEILLDEEPMPRIRVEVHHRYVPRQRQHVPPWLIVLAILAALMWMAPLGTIILIAIVSIFFASHPTIAFVIGGMIALVAIAAMRERWHRRPF
jgi:hypothetical protein